METLPPSQPASEKSSDSVERWHLTEELFHRALTYSSDERVEQARAWCGADSTLLAQLLALIESNSSVEELIAAAPPVERQEFLLRQESPEVSPNPAAADPWLGRMLGSFRIESVLGRGGMGVVYLGQRVTEGFTQTVAIKVIARHLRSSPAVSQFLLERETLAKLEHPNIARLLDGGVEDDIPYVVMEYIDGQRLDAVCDDLATTIETTIRLTLQLCDAVIYVHRNLILHRDLKPGNVMVTSDGIVKLLDFGTLKLMSALAVDSDMTQAGMRSVTLRYASPEHIRGDAVSTASDVYSVGMLLYRLIAGHLPGGMDNLSVGQYLVRFRETKISPPSADKNIPSRLAKDLDAIVMKAIRFDAKDRYPSVSAFAADLSNALQDEPVAAREGNLRYHLGKFYRHRRTAVLGAAAILIILAVGLAAIVHQDRIARAETRRAEAGIERERKLAHLLLFDYFEQLKQIPGSTDAQHKAVLQALSYLDSLTLTPSGSQLELDKIQAYTEMGILLGDPYEENLGDTAGATRILQKILPESLAIVRIDPNNLEYLQTSAATQTALGQILNGTGQARQALQDLAPAGETSRRIAASPNATVPMLVQAAYVLNSLGDVYGQESDFSLHSAKTSMSIYQESLDINAHALSLNPHCARCRSGIALAYWKLGMMSREDDQDKAAEYYRDGLATLAAFTPVEQASTRIRRMDTFIRHRLGEVDLSNGHPEEGVRMLETTRERFKLAVAADKLDSRPRWDLGPLDVTLGDGYVELKQYDKALDAYREYVEMMDFLVHREPKSSTYQVARAEALLYTGKVQTILGQTQAGERTSSEGLALILSMAQMPAAQTNELDLAANALVRLHRDQKHDASLALSFAQREVAASASASVDQLLTLAETQRYAGLIPESQETAQRVSKLLSLHPNSIGSSDERAKINNLLSP
jgi:non-specific serine/threonine protein kinase/serine/threonine-protein kinase